MNKLLITLLILLSASISNAQSFKTGAYSFGLRLAYDKTSNKLTGYFEDYTGLDEETGAPRFSCIFYIEGEVKNNQFSISTYYPFDDPSEAIEGTLTFIDDNQVAIKLSEEHGGCWNVMHFADKEPTKFQLEKQQKWVKVSYIKSEKAFFHKDKSIDNKQKAYLIKGDFVCIEKIDGEWAYCTYFSDKTTSGWIPIKHIH